MSSAANGAMKTFLSMMTPVVRVVVRERWGAHASVGSRAEHRKGARSLAGRTWLLALDDQAAREGVGFDHALPLAERRLQPAAAHPVLALGSALHREVDLVAKLAAVRGVAQLERALRVDVQPQLAGDRLGAQMAGARTGAGRVETAGRRLELHLRRGPGSRDDRMAGDGVEPHRTGSVLDVGIARDHLQI